MNYLDDNVMENGIKEMFRVSKKWIMHCEKYEKSEKQIDKNHKFRNMGIKWLNYKIKLVSDVDLHEDYGQEQTRFTLLKKYKINYHRYHSHYKPKLFLKGQLRLGQLRLGQLRLGQLRLGQLRLGQLRLGQLRLGQLLQYKPLIS